ncbi:MAG: LysE family translocator [Rhodobacteraceae bacterium]|nr:LysE family translocator [Paracoccaceae bacterium]
MHGLIGFVLAGFALAGSPGPATLSTAAAGAAFGARGGIAYMLGIVAGLVMIMGMVATGVAGILLELPGATPVITIASASYFIYLAFRIATAPPMAQNPDEQKRPTFYGGIFLSLVNPKGYAAMAALSSGFVLVSSRFELDTAMKMVAVAAIATTALSIWLSSGAVLARFYRDSRISRVVNVIFALLLVVSVALTLLL